MKDLVTHLERCLALADAKYTQRHRQLQVLTPYLKKAEQ